MEARVVDGRFLTHLLRRRRQPGVVHLQQGDALLTRLHAFDERLALAAAIQQRWQQALAEQSDGVPIVHRLPSAASEQIDKSRPALAAAFPQRPPKKHAPIPRRAANKPAVATLSDENPANVQPVIAKPKPATTAVSPPRAPASESSPVVKLGPVRQQVRAAASTPRPVVGPTQQVRAVASAQKLTKTSISISPPPVANGRPHAVQPHPAPAAPVAGRPLPLAQSPSSMTPDSLASATLAPPANGVIQRTPVGRTGGVVQRTGCATPGGPAPSATTVANEADTTMAAAGADVAPADSAVATSTTSLHQDDLVARMTRRFQRQLEIEQERRGGTTWR